MNGASLCVHESSCHVSAAGDHLQRESLNKDAAAAQIAQQ
jgi:hypothetical protein